MQCTRHLRVILLACLFPLLTAPAFGVDMSCPAELGGIPLLRGNPEDPEPGTATEIPGLEGSYIASCNYKSDRAEISVTAKWRSIQGGDVYGCADSKGLQAQQETSDGRYVVLRSKDHQAQVDIFVSDPTLGPAAVGLGAKMLGEAAGEAGGCSR